MQLVRNNLRNKLTRTQTHPTTRKPNKNGLTYLSDTPSIRLWSRRSRVRIPSLTLRKSLENRLGKAVARGGALGLLLS